MSALPQRPQPSRALGAAAAPDEALTRFFSLRDWKPTSIETVALEAACGRVIVDDFVSPYALPSRPHAATEGYAIRVADLASGHSLRCSFVTRAGKSAVQSVRRGEAVRVSEGSILPPGCDAVVPIESAHLEQGRLQIKAGTTRGNFVVPVGTDVEANRTLIPAGMLLSLADIATLAAFGLESVRVRMLPTIALVTFGDEIASQGVPLRPWQSYNVSRYVVGAALSELGARVVPLRAQRQNAGGLIATLTMAVSHADAVIVSGDSESHRRTDVAIAIETLSSNGIVAEGIRMNPGSATVIGVVGNVPIVGIPGTARAALLTLRIIGDPIIRRLAGLPSTSKTLTCTVREEIRGESERDTIALVHVDGNACRPVLSSASRSSVFAGADGFVRVPAALGQLRPGCSVSVERLSQQ